MNKLFKAQIVFFYLMGSSVFAQTEKSSITIANAAQYENKESIQSDVVRQCTMLNTDFAQAIKDNLENDGFSVVGVNAIDTKAKGLVLDMQIISVNSEGNGFIGHDKSMSVRAILYKDGEKLDSRKLTKSLQSGSLIKNSCRILVSLGNAVAVDVLRWVKVAR